MTEHMPIICKMVNLLGYVRAECARTFCSQGDLRRFKGRTLWLRHSPPISHCAPPPPRPCADSPVFPLAFCFSSS